ncbi:MAG: hypothetical protein V3R64_05170 [Sphingomonadales bacterium]
MTRILTTFDDENLETVEYNHEQEIISFCAAFRSGDKAPLNKWLTEADEDDYQTHRKKIRTELDWDIRAVDKKRKSLSRKTAENTQGRAVQWEETLPFGSKVEGAPLFSEIAQTIQTYVVLTSEQANAVVGWAVMSWLHYEGLTKAPFLNIT